MINNIIHVGITVKNMDKSIEFYRDVLGLKFLGEIVMEGKETEILFGRENCRVRVAYLSESDKIGTPPVELIQFTDSEAEDDTASLHKVSISEICFCTDDIDGVYEELKGKSVEFISEPQDFDFTEYGFGKSRAVYFRDNNGIILELMQNL